ncbi:MULTISPECIES: sarcosine oxidase subunit gamma [Bradyrhizobium]|uniref:sarcosine oxidase subunit gamma n=1 Tax=Bradyrhizobium centrosematis TaxID=1300039 RepID=UPI00216A378A|nr:sarcosine oxidase subunit gamma family protein [Bradyrhizobium centrosematis]MCS3765955.1 sarcosine oxidase subunit gamma [Bradyrhizobium centrosematis]MCS3778188.1 sarcosine oxidase subunit gamma [Bradyrhizobium centrosematis]
MPEQVTSMWRSRDCWAGIINAEQIGADGEAGVTLLISNDLQLATLITRPDSSGLQRLTKQLIGLDLPQTSSAALTPTHGLVWSGPDQWLLIARQRAGFSDLLGLLSAEAAVSDQSHARAAMTVSGKRVREVLAKGSMVDLHSKVFPVGATVLTSFAHVNVQLWRTEDGSDGPVFEILVPRSMAGSFWSWFVASVAEFGCRISTCRN